MLIPGGKLGVWIAGGLGFLVVLLGIVLSLIPPGEATNKVSFEAQLVAATGLAILVGLVLRYFGRREKIRAA